MHTKNWRNQKSSAKNNDYNDASFEHPFDGINQEVQGTFLSDDFKDNESSNKERKNMRKTEGSRAKKSVEDTKTQRAGFRKVGRPSYASKKILSKSSENSGVHENSGEQQMVRFDSDTQDEFQVVSSDAKIVKTHGVSSHARTEHETSVQQSQNRGGDGYMKEQATSSRHTHSDTEESKWSERDIGSGDGIEENHNNKYQFRNKVGVLDLTRNSTEVRKWHDSSARTENRQENRQKYVEEPRNHAPRETINLKDLKNKTAEELLNLAESLKIENPSYLHKHDLVFAISKVFAEQGTIIVGDGMLEILQDGYGFLRSSEANYIPGPDDIYVSPVYIKKFALRTGDTIVGPIRAPKKGERYFALTNINTLTGLEISKNKHRVHFDDLTPIYPMKQIKLETEEPQKDFSGRIIDMVAPLGRGQRALIVAPPRTGKTILMQNISHSITSNYPEIQLIVLLIGERPEEVTDMSRSVCGEVVSSTFDEPSYRHVQLAEMVIEKAKRMVERGQDVVILLDSITRLARAYNDVVPSSGKVLSGGVDSNALQRPKRLLGAARNTEEGGSLTIIATALVETGSKMDEVIFEEFKGTGNLEIILDRKISDKRIFPAIDIVKSGTRKEDLLIDKATLSKIWVLRRVMNPMGANEAIEFLNDKLRYHKNNHEFFEQMNTYK